MRNGFLGSMVCLLTSAGLVLAEGEATLPR